MKITLDENYLCRCDSDILGYVGETNSRTIEFKGLHTDGADNYFMRFEYHDGKAYDADISNEKYEINGSILREAKMVSCQIIASKRIGEEYTVVRKSNVFQLKISKSLDGTPTAIPTFEQSESALEKVLESESKAKTYASTAELSATSATASADSAAVSATSATNSAASASNSAVSAAASASECNYRDGLISNIMQMTTTNFLMLKSKAGTFDIVAYGFTNPVWEYNGAKSSGTNGVFTILHDGDCVKLSWDSASATKMGINKNGTKTAIFNLADLYGKLTASLFCFSTSVTGNLTDLQGKLTVTLNCNGTSITGDLADLQGKLTESMCCDSTQIVGNLADLQGKLTDTLSCYHTSITGIYTPTTAVPNTTNLSSTLITTADMDSTLIAYASKATELSKQNGTFTATGMTRTAASDEAIATLVSAGWTVSGLTKVVA